MKIKTNRTLSTIALILLLTISAMMATLPAASAHTPAWSIPTWTYVTVSPNPVGVGQQVLVVFWVDKLPQTANGQFGDRWKFTLTVTKPDGTAQNLGTFTSDPVGGGYALFTPDNVGTYYFQASFPQQILAGLNPEPGGNQYSISPYINDTYLASVSDKVPLTVQQAQITNVQEAPLPTNYWTRPVSSINRGWSAISGNWVGLLSGMLGAGQYNAYSFNPYSTAPNTSHVVWTKPLDFGGITGGAFGDVGYYTGSAYEGKWSAPTIIQGRLYYNAPQSDQPATGGLMCVDLRTGQQIWWSNGTTLSKGQIYDYESPNQHGTIAYLLSLSGSTMKVYDPFSGCWLFTITNVPSGVSAWGKDGSYLIYTMNSAKGYMTLWNSSAIPALLLGNQSGTNMWQWRPVGKTVDGNTGYVWNVTIPKDIPTLSRDTVVALDDSILGTSGCNDRYYTNAYTVYRLNLKPGLQGQVMWRKDYQSPPVINTTVSMALAVDPDAGVFAMNLKEPRTWYFYDLNTGNLLKGPTAPQASMDMYGMGGAVAYGKLFSYGYGGIVYAYDMKSGSPLWATPLGTAGLEGPYQYWPAGSGSGIAIADHKIYVTTYEHSTTEPLYRAWSIYCIDTETGKMLWNITALSGAPVIADGYMVLLNSMDNQIYCFGMGETATTVSTQTFAAPQGTPVLIQGTVTDQSPGVTGTPAISDAYMTEWMQYEYMQQTIPNKAVGVKVHLTAIDPNGNFQDIGNITSDITGNYKTAWTPPVPGTYTIIATFAGSNSYFGSSSETGLLVAPAPSAAAVVTPAPTQPPVTVAPTLPPTVAPTQTFAPTPSPVVIPPTSAASTTTYIAIGAVVIIAIAAAAALILRRRK